MKRSPSNGIALERYPELDRPPELVFPRKSREESQLRRSAARSVSWSLLVYNHKCNRKILSSHLKKFNRFSVRQSPGPRPAPSSASFVSPEPIVHGLLSNE